MGRLGFRAIEFKPESHWTIGANYVLGFTSSGNLELGNITTGEVIWQTDTRGQRMAMQADGNLVIYGDGQHVLWASDTAGNDDAMLVAGDDGELMIVTSDFAKVLWNTTVNKLPLKESAAESDEQPPPDPVKEGAAESDEQPPHDSGAMQT